MSTYHLHARRFEGSLAAPARNELRSGEGDDLAELTRRAQDLTAEGFTVWVYEHGPGPRPTSGQGPYRVLRELRPGEPATAPASG